MAPVQAKSNSGSTASLAVGATQGWATPAAGHLLVAFTNSHNTATAPTGAGTWSTGPSVVDGNGAYVWYKVADGTETTITFANGAAASNVGVLEYAGVAASPFDVQNSATASVSGTSTPSVSATTTAAGDLVVALALLHNTAASAATSPTWTNSFVNELTAASAGTTTSLVESFVADLTAGAAGAVSTVCSWTNAMIDRQALIIAFKASAAATAAPIRPKAPSRVPIFRAANY